MGMEGLCVLTVANRYRDVHIPSMGLQEPSTAPLYSLYDMNRARVLFRESVYVLLCSTT